MSVSLERNGNEATLKIFLPVEDVAKAFDKAVARINRQVTIPGFRKGHAPRKVLEVRVGKDAIKSEAFEVIANEQYRQAVKDNKLVPVTDPEVKESNFEEGKPLDLILGLVLRPEPELGEYKDLDVKKEEKEITDADVDKELENLQKRAAKMVEAPEGKALEKGDLAIIDFKGTVDGEAFAGGEGKGYPLEVGSGSFIPGFEDQLVGKKKGESVDVNVTFPEDYAAKELAGKAAVFSVHIQDVKVKEVPEINDELIAANSDSKTVEEFRQKTMDRMKKAEADRAQAAYERQLVQTAVDNAKFEVPDQMVDQRADAMVDELTMNLEQHKMSLPMYLQYLGKDVKTYRDEQKPIALQQIRTDLVLDAIALKENVQVSQNEIAAEVQQLAAMNGATVKQVEKVISQNGSIALLVSGIARRKAARIVIDNAKGAAPAEAKATETAEVPKAE